MNELKHVVQMADDKIKVSTRLGMAHVVVSNPYGGYEFTVPVKLLAHFAWVLLRHYVVGTWFGWRIKRAYKRLALQAPTPANE
jgi:hypothetical protein